MTDEKKKIRRIFQLTGRARWRDIVIGDGHDRYVVEERKRDDHDRGQRLELERYDRRHYDCHDVESHGDTVIDITLDTLKNLPRNSDGVQIVESPGAVRMSAAALRAASVAPLTAMPQSACLSAGASLTPSPVMATICPRD